MSKKENSKFYHRRVNNILTVSVMVFGLYLIAAPLIPELMFRWRQYSGFNQPAYVATPSAEVNLPKENRLAIPSIGIDEEILEGQSNSTVDKGVWRRPATGTPFSGGNTVLVSHRYSYEPGIKKAFYNLDKVKTGDKIYVVWQQKSYAYRVVKTEIVPPSQVEVEAPTMKAQLTLYTCTPLWTSTNRLVVTALPERTI